LGVDYLQAPLHPLAAVTRDLLGRRQFRELLGPLGAVALVGQPRAQPAQAVLLDGRQHRAAAAEHLGAGNLTGAPACVRVDDLQGGRGLSPGLLRPTTQFGYRGGGVAQEDGQQDASSGEGDADGLADGGELGLLVRGEDDGETELLAGARQGLHERWGQCGGRS
jgi:hypothetical protein